MSTKIRLKVGRPAPKPIPKPGQKATKIKLTIPAPPVAVAVRQPSNLNVVSGEDDLYVPRKSKSRGSRASGSSTKTSRKRPRQNTPSGAAAAPVVARVSPTPEVAPDETTMSVCAAQKAIFACETPMDVVADEIWKENALKSKEKARLGAPGVDAAAARENGESLWQRIRAQSAASALRSNSCGIDSAKTAPEVDLSGLWEKAREQQRKQRERELKQLRLEAEALEARKQMEVEGRREMEDMERQRQREREVQEARAREEELRLEREREEQREKERQEMNPMGYIDDDEVDGWNQSQAMIGGRLGGFGDDQDDQDDTLDF